MPVTRMRRAVAGAALLGAGAIATVAVASGGSPADRSAELRAAIDASKPRNVILFTGDGMGDSEITSARYYAKGASGRLAMDALPFTGEDTTFSVKPGSGPDYAPDYVPDSAATGTAWATGRKTIDNRISQGPSSAANVPGDNASYRTVLELAQQAGKRVGNVSTAEITDATPAVLGSHISQRACQGPANTRSTCPSETKQAGGLGSIAEQLVDHRIDVILGGGKSRFTQTLDGSSTTVLDRAQAQLGYRYAGNATQLAGISSLKNGPVLGLFNDGNMTTTWTGPSARRPAASAPYYGAPVRCDETNRATSAPGEPSLEQMTNKAIELLDNKKGFFLQVEGASIDKQDHAANPCKQIGELIAFDDAIAAARRYQRTHPDTLIVVTADHAHTSQIVPEDASGGTGLPTGYALDLQTKDDATMRIAYGTAGGPTPPATPDALSQEHTGSEVRIAASGPQAANVNGILDQTELFSILVGRGRGHSHGNPGHSSNHGRHGSHGARPRGDRGHR